MAVLAVGTVFLVAVFLAVVVLAEALAAGFAAVLALVVAVFALAGAYLAAAALGFTVDVRLRVAFLGSSTTGGL